MLLISFNAHSASNCGVKIVVQDVNWTGECKDGYANGIGLLSYKFKSQNLETFGKMDNGKSTGLHLLIFYEGNQTYRFVKYYIDGEESDIGPVIITGTDNMHFVA